MKFNKAEIDEMLKQKIQERHKMSTNGVSNLPKNV